MNRNATRIGRIPDDELFPSGATTVTCRAICLVFGLHWQFA